MEITTETPPAWQSALTHTARGAPVCARCQRRCVQAWAYQLGNSTVVTCHRRACQPPSPPWIVAYIFVPTRDQREDAP